MVVDGDFVRAEGTTWAPTTASAWRWACGGRGSDLRARPVEVLVTVDEERGLTGAAASSRLLTARKMINLDTKRITSSASAARAAATRSSTSCDAGARAKDSAARKVTVTGLLGATPASRSTATAATR